MTSVREGSVPATQPGLTLAGTADAQVCQVGCEVAGAAGAAQRREGGFLGVQRGREGGGEVDVGQVRQGAPRVVGGRDQGCSVFLVSRWKDAGGKGQTEGAVSSRGGGWPVLPRKLWQGQEKAGAKKFTGAK